MMRIARWCSTCAPPKKGSTCVRAVADAQEHERFGSGKGSPCMSAVADAMNRFIEEGALEPGTCWCKTRVVQQENYR
eukprot:743168-Pelagomonas_calceolata.AAC.6